MATEEVLRGPTGETVRENVQRLRKKRGLSLRALAARTENMNRPLGHGSINAIEQGRRRVDVDDLMVLAAALHVNPLSLLFPYPHEHGKKLASKDNVEASGIGRVALGVLWSWGKGLFRPTWMNDPDDEWNDTDEMGVRAADDEDGVFVFPLESSAMMGSMKRDEQRKRDKLFELFDMYVDEYRKDRHGMRVRNGDD